MGDCWQRLVLGLQFYTLFKTAHICDHRAGGPLCHADPAGFCEKGIPSYIESPTNQQFVLLTEEQKEKLAKNHIFENQFRTEDGRFCVRFCTSWSTKDEEVEAF